MDLKKHKASFTFRTLGGSCLGERWIYDHDEPIAQFSNATIDAPQHELLYFGNCPRPLLLQKLKLQPGQRPLFASVPLYWRFGPKGIYTTVELLGLEVAGEKSDTLSLTFIATDKERVGKSIRTLTLPYCQETMSYIYDFNCELLIMKRDTEEKMSNWFFEISDPMYADLPGPSQEFSGMWTKPGYSHFIAELTDDSIWQIPINHIAARAVDPAIGIKRDGLFMPAFEAGHNPAIQLMGETGPRSTISVCHWGYDVHILPSYTEDEFKENLNEQFRLFRCGDDKADAMFLAKTERESVDYRGLNALPYHLPVNSFAEGIKLNEPTNGVTDPCLWEPTEGMEEGTEWCHDMGRTDNHSLKICKRSSGSSQWVMSYEGQGGFTDYWTRSIGFKISIWVKTEDVADGTYLGLGWRLFHQPLEIFPMSYSERLSATNEWTELTAELVGPPPDGVHDIIIFLQQDGSGTSWFDDFELVKTSSESSGD